MAETARARRHFARLSFEDGEVVVTPKDRAIFVISAGKATEACLDAVQDKERFERFESEILLPLHDWCLANRDKVRACYVPIPTTHLSVFVVTKSARFDFDLAAAVAALELDLAGKGWRVVVSQLPSTSDDSSSTYFNHEGALEVYAQPGSASEEG